MSDMTSYFQDGGHDVRPHAASAGCPLARRARVTSLTAPRHIRTCRTRKPCYRKDDRAMRPIYGCPEKFRESSQTPPATFPEICKGLLFRSILRMCIQNLKFVALSVPEIIGGTQKIWAVPRYANAPFSLEFLKGFCSDGPCEYTCQI